MRSVVGLVGRDEVSALLARAWDGARGRLVLLSGEPGIGKTALAAQLSEQVADQGAATAWGVCTQAGGVPAFWPWPDVVEQLGGPLTPPGSDPDSAWFACATAVVRAVREVQPALLVLDDLQWAGPGALRVLDFVVRRLQRDRVLVLGTYRDTEVDSGHPLTGLAGSAEIVALQGIGVDDVGRLLGERRALAEQVHRRTGGNPFFVQQITRLLAAGGTAAQVPAAVGEAVGRRLARLPQPTVQLLDLAAVGGNDVDAAVLARAAGIPYADAVSRLAPAVAARIVRPAEAVGAYRFEHDLYREARVAALDDTTRSRAHLAYAQALEADPTSAAGPIAYHYARAVPAAEPAQARLRVVKAAEAATARHSYEEAAELRRDAVRLAELDGTVDATALVDLGDALLDAGEPRSAREAYRRSIGDDLTLRARSALGLHRAGVTSGDPRADLVALLESVAGRVGGVLGARVRAALARELADGPGADVERARSLATEAVRAAESSADPGTLAACLFAQHDVLWGPDTAAVRLGVIDRMIAAADAAGEVAIAGEGAQLRFAALAELADPAAASALDDLAGRARRDGRPRLRYLAVSRRAAYALLTGAPEDAARLAGEARELGEAIGEPDTMAVYATQTVAVELVRGGAPGMGAVLKAVGGPLMPPEMLVHQRMFELLAAGDRVAAAALLRSTVHSGESSMYRWRAVARTALEIEIAVASGAADVCPVLYAQLEPHAGQMVLIGGAVAILPPIDFYLGLAAAAAGQVDRAAPHLRDAIAIAERLGARAYATRARVELEALEPPQRHEFRRTGEIWTLTFDGITARVPDAKGLRDLARLVGVPGQEISARELAGDPTPDTGSDDVLDERAKSAYKKRLSELDADIEEATADSDRGRRDRATAERDALVSALAQAYGLGGRARRLKDPGERARTAVTARIRDAIKRIEPVHPSLAEHLRAAVQTGRQCSYRPDPPVRWTV